MSRVQICLAFEEVGVEEFGNCFEWLPEFLLSNSCFSIYALNVSPSDLAFEEVGVEEFGNCFEWLPELFQERSNQWLTFYVRPKCLACRFGI
jgi:hypothetical protein